MFPFRYDVHLPLILRKQRGREARSAAQAAEDDTAARGYQENKCVASAYALCRQSTTCEPSRVEPKITQSTRTAKKKKNALTAEMRAPSMLWSTRTMWTLWTM
ncbi:hypothetical protein GN958_ATG17536 [Phytophthora infestans]|uniref:Uncharacterized protein n=1 Tax=Phytophthora infestans TaxID=4787 RepID=A0A8S9TZ23_PHYIN|nr:hypothetical protein GN958_ATG17536 [Phytophthora infestans]